MGYPMTYPRVVKRNGLAGGYDQANPNAHANICGDLRRLEADSLDDQQTAILAAFSGANADQVRRVLRAFLFQTDDEEFKAFYTSPDFFARVRQGSFFARVRRRFLDKG